MDLLNLLKLSITLNNIKLNFLFTIIQMTRIYKAIIKVFDFHTNTYKYSIYSSSYYRYIDAVVFGIKSCDQCINTNSPDYYYSYYIYEFDAKDELYFIFNKPSSIKSHLDTSSKKNRNCNFSNIFHNLQKLFIS